MSIPVDRNYWQRRHLESLARAKMAEDPGVARVHRDFADHYARRLGDFRSANEEGRDHS